MSSNNTLENKIDEIKHKINEYTCERSICVSLFYHLKSISGVTPILQPEIVNAEDKSKHKIPDMLIIIDEEYIILDVKVLHNKNDNAMESRVEEVREYAGSWLYDNKVFSPKLVICIPKNRVKKSKSITDVSVIDFDIDNANVELSVISQSMDKTNFFIFFTNERLIFPLDVNPTHFLRTEPQISYVAERVYAMLQAAKPMDLSKPDYYPINIKKFIKMIHNIFPPILRTKNDDPIPQLADGRVRKALVFLEKDKFVEINGETLHLPRNRGGGTADLLEHFIRLQAKQEMVKEKRKKKLSEKQFKSKITKIKRDRFQMKLSDY